LAAYVYGTAIARGHDGVLLLGLSNAGKSDLALRCLSAAITHPPGEAFTLVSDDQTVLETVDGNLEMMSSATIAGRLEVRGLGIFTFPFRECTRLRLIVRLTDRPIERLPDNTDFIEYFHGHAIRRIWLHPFTASAPAKIALALHSLI